MFKAFKITLGILAALVVVYVAVILVLVVLLHSL
jgi:hypothetical protein